MTHYTLDDFDFDLPKELIAQHPLSNRTASRLLCLNRKTGEIQHRLFLDLPTFLRKNDLLVFNNTKVIPARLFGYKETGGKIGCLIERIISPTSVLAHLRSNKTPKIGTAITICCAKEHQNITGIEGVKFIVTEKKENLYTLTMASHSPYNVYNVIDQYGHMPLPPYIKREDTVFDERRYQTVYAKKVGAIAAPTAGLHFDESLLQTITSLGITKTELTLHVGSGTFQPVRVKDFKSHVMHKEYFELSQENCDAVIKTQHKQGRVVAIGTTVVRTLEAVAQKFNPIQPLSGDTQLFIYPGFEFRSVDVLLTNFHLPKSTLLMLVSAFGGYDHIMQAYQEAIKEKYRFFSYGDAMFIYHNSP